VAGILIVEDDEDIRSDLIAILSVKGYSVAGSANGQEALAHLRAPSTSVAPPAVILLDLRMPVMNGWEFLAAQKEDPALSAIPVIICSGDGNVDPKSMSAAGFLRKPFELSHLFSLLKQYA
jgi:CheY-like chemotaxis protein